MSLHYLSFKKTETNTYLAKEFNHDQQNIETLYDFKIFFLAGGRHFSTWERTTHFRNQGNSSLITTVEQTTLKPVIKPIPSRLGSPLTMIKYEPKMFHDLSAQSNNSSIKLGRSFECFSINKANAKMIDITN
jgi:hypothetical protein